MGVRLPGDEQVDGGLTQSDLLEIAALIAGTGLVDYLNIIVGTNYERAGRMDHGRLRLLLMVCSCHWLLASNPTWPYRCSRPGGSPIPRWPMQSSNAVMPIWLA